MQLPEQFIKSLQSLKGFDEKAFVQSHHQPEPFTSVRINPRKSIDVQNFGQAVVQVPWSRYGYYLSERPSFTFDPLFHAGCYYVQEASSMFLEQALKQTVDLSQPLKVLDLCAAPGGKSTHIQSLISAESLLVCNEVIKSRVGILKDNIIKWGCNNVVVSNNDPRDFAKLENFFDVLVIDAPCSGSGLFRKDAAAIEEWSENSVLLCSQRQQRIIADAWPALKKDGILIYSTCSYSAEEDEEILDGIHEQFAVETIPLQLQQDWNITETISEKGLYGYRFWPHRVNGEGFFISCLRKKEGKDDFFVSSKNKPETVSKKEAAVVKEWVKSESFFLFKNKNILYAFPPVLYGNINILLASFYVQYSGVVIGQVFADKFVPEHALAMSSLVLNSVPEIELNYEQSIRYLQKKDLDADISQKGWYVVNYKGHSLGWIKNIGHRINNYYPKELRILKDSL